MRETSSSPSAAGPLVASTDPADDRRRATRTRRSTTGSARGCPADPAHDRRRALRRPPRVGAARRGTVRLVTADERRVRAIGPLRGDAVTPLPADA